MIKPVNFAMCIGKRKAEEAIVLVERRQVPFSYIHSEHVGE